MHLGAIGDKMFDAERELRRLYDSGTRDGERVEELRGGVPRLRREQIGPWLEQARVTLRELAQYAGELGVAIGIENRLHYHEIPQPRRGGRAARRNYRTRSPGTCTTSAMRRCSGGSGSSTSGAGWTRTARAASRRTCMT